MTVELGLTQKEILAEMEREIEAAIVKARRAIARLSDKTKR